MAVISPWCKLLSFLRTDKILFMRVMSSRYDLSFIVGLHMYYNVKDSILLFFKFFLSTYYFLKFENIKKESRVIVSQLNTVNGFGTLHTPPVAF